MPFSTPVRRFVLLLASLFALATASCGTSAPVAPDRSGDAFLQDQLALLDTMSAPAGVDLVVWTEITGSLRSQLQARLEGKLPAAAPNSNASRASLSLNAATLGLSWGFASQGDYDQNGEVNAADLTPIAVHYQQNTGGAGPFGAATAESVIDGDNNGEINAADITPIAQNLGRHLFSYNVYGAADVSGLPATNSGPNGTGAQLLGTVGLSQATGDPKQVRLTLAFDASAFGPPTEVYWVRPNDAADGSGADGTASNAAGSGVVLPISGAVETDANVALAGVTMTLTGASTLTATTAADGSYTFAAVPAGNYTLTPSLANCAFTPPSRSVTAGSGSGQDFTASLDVADTPYGFTLNLFGDGQKVIRFQKGTAIDVYVDNTGIGVPGWQASFDSAIRDASMIWNEVGQPWGLFTIRQTLVEADAEMVFTWVPTLGGAKMGEAQLSATTPSTLNLPVTIEMAVANIFGPATDPIIRMITVHEMGHALGIWDHSDRDTDIMFPSVGLFEDPSPRDILTMYTLYNTPADYSAGARGTSSIGLGETRTIRMP